MKWNDDKQTFSLALFVGLLLTISEPALGKEPTAEELFKSGVIAAKEHQPDRAIILMQRCIKKDPSAITAYINLSNYYARDKQNLKAAEEVIAKALKIAPNDADVQYTQAQIFLDERKYVEARQVLRKIHVRNTAERDNVSHQIVELDHLLGSKKVK